MDMTPGQNYKGFEGGLYENSSNTVPSVHDAEGMTRAGLIQPLDMNGAPATLALGGRIVVIGIGMSNWTQELCHAQSQADPCDPFTFLGQAKIDPRVNQTTVLIDCALSAQIAGEWVDDVAGDYTACKTNHLTPAGVSEKQVQVILWKDANAQPNSAITSAQGQTPSTYCLSNPAVDACKYLGLVSQVMRFAKFRYPNLQQVFVHSRIYAGYATSDLNPEPFAYEYGFATKWLVEAQINQVHNNTTRDPFAGDLDYRGVTARAPWIAWGPYFWAAGSTPRSDGLVWVPSDFNSIDFTHPSADGRMKVAVMMMNFYLASPYTPWFRK